MDGGLVNRAPSAGPALPFAMIPVAAFLAGRGRWTGLATWLAAVLALAGGVLILAFPGGRGPDPSGCGCALAGDRLAALDGPRSTSLVVDRPALHGQRDGRAGSRLGATTAVSRQAIQFLPLVVAQFLAIVAIFWTARGGTPGPGSRRLDLGVDEQKQSGGADQDAQDPEAEPQRRASRYGAMTRGARPSRPG